MSTVLVTIAAFIFVLGVLIVLHEAGHFALARLLGAPVEVFSIGFGKRLWGFKRGGTDYRVSAVPFGGYVRIVGLGPDESTVVGQEAAEVELLAKWKRVLILVAGPLANVVSAVVFLALAFMVGVEVPAYYEQAPVVGWVEPDSPAAEGDLRPGDQVTAADGQAIATWRDLEMALLTSGGRDISLTVSRDGAAQQLVIHPKKVTRYDLGYTGVQPFLDPVVVQLQPGGPAAAAGLEAGDRILAVNGEPVRQFYDLFRLIAPHPDEAITLSIDRSGRQLELSVTPRSVGGEGKVGINMVHPTVLKKLGPVAAVAAGIDEARRLTGETFRVLRRLVTRKASFRQISGPLEIARISGEAAKSGLHRLVWLMGLISLQLGILNLLPVPILDGGHLAVIGIEAVIRRDLPTRVKDRIVEVGFYLLIALLVVVMFNDIVKYLPERLYRVLYPGGTP